ncbi:hypothetical protein F511_25140 [Dorcoceras hygrometricum]|uniref:Uncharacterized protein n=1 Tax=Dorcoceras hygrometricum TaxID=472368 RepID=A0A2Z7CR31_9LAMI|nr:hypothetical protein F511_25140 [Dorcoceras hygrometricum]
MGNTEPNNTKQENKYEVKPQYEELSKQLIMQHAIINSIKCMRAIKDRIARPVYQLAIISVRLYTRTVYQPGKSSVRHHRSPSAHHSSVVFRHNKSVGHHYDDSVGLFRHNSSKLSRTSNLLGKLNIQRMPSSNQNFLVAIPTVKNLTPVLLLNKVLESNTKLRTLGISYPTAGTSRRTIGFHCTKKSAASRSSPRSLHSFKWVTIERASHRDSSATKIAQIIGGERRQSAGIKSRSLATGTRRNTQNAAFPLNQTTSLLISDWFFKPNTCRFLDHSHNCAPAASSNHHKRNYCQTQHQTSRSHLMTSCFLLRYAIADVSFAVVVLVELAIRCDDVAIQISRTLFVVIVAQEVKASNSKKRPPPSPHSHAVAGHSLCRRVPPSSAVRRPLRDRTCFDHRDEVIPSVANPSAF